MDVMSSPYLPAKSQYGATGIETLIAAKKQSRGREQFDDSSSVTSMSSSSRAIKCYVCKDPEVLPTKPLMICVKCQRRWHKCCALPLTDEQTLREKYNADFICKKCVGKTTTSTTGTPTVYTSPYAVPNSKPSSSIPISNEARDASKMTASYICEAEGCDKPIYHNPSDVRPLCKMHTIEKRYKHSTIRKEQTRPITVSKPFRKDKMYPLPANDKPFVNPSLKRKRTTPRASKYFASEDGTFASDAGRPVSSPPKGVIRKVTSTATLPLKPTPTRTLQQRGKVLNSLATIGSSNSHELDPNSSPDMINNSRHSEQLVEQESPEYEPPEASPEYEPPPPQVEAEAINLVNDITRNPNDDSPGSQIAQELRATASQHETPDSSSHGHSQPSPRLPPLTSIQEQEISNSLPVSPTVLSVPMAMEDEAMADVVPEHIWNVVKRVDAALEHLSSPSKSNSPRKNGTPPPQDGYVLSSPSEYDSEEEIESDIEEEMDIDHEPEPQPVSVPESDLGHIETTRAERVSTFDESILDSYLLKQSQPKGEPTTRELLDGQIWGAVDPRVAWPKPMTAYAYEEKQKEIQARGGRKANFGKILTAQVRKERADQGWHIHQRGELRDDEESRIMREKLEELMGKPIGHAVPGIRDERLVMIEKEEFEEPQTGPGRRRKKNQPKVYPVFGGQ